MAQDPYQALPREAFGGPQRFRGLREHDEPVGHTFLPEMRSPHNPALLNSTTESRYGLRRRAVQKALDAQFLCGSIQYLILGLFKKCGSGPVEKLDLANG